MSWVRKVEIKAAIVASIGLATSLMVSLANANSNELVGMTVPASSCVPSGTPAQNALGVWSLGRWILSKNGTFKLTCALPVSSGQMTGYRISYRDPDGRTGNASLKAFLLRRDVPPTFGPGNAAFLPCDFLSNVQGTVTGTFTNQTVVCNQAINANAFHFFEIELWRRAAAGGADAYVTFLGIDFPSD